MKHTMRSAFKRWLILHNEEWRAKNSYIRLPNWFRHYIRNNTEWAYTVIGKESNYYCNIHELDYNARRRYKGYYTFEISDEELLNLQRPEWIKDDQELKNGDRVYHKRLKRYGTFIEYDWTGKDECHVKFDINDGYEKCLHVTTKQLILIK